MKGGETRAAIAAADSILPKWKEMTAKVRKVYHDPSLSHHTSLFHASSPYITQARSVILRRWHDLILEHQDDIATLMTIECGKPLAESKAEVASGAASVEWFAEECR